MSTSMLYLGFGINGYHYTRYKYQQGALVFRIEKEPTSLRCPSCKGIQVIRKGTAALRWFLTLPIRCKQVYLKLQRQTESAGKKFLIGTCWLLLKNPEHISLQHNEKQRLEIALRLKSSLATVYYLKEHLRQQQDQDIAKTGIRFSGFGVL